jgi:predicted metal-dependent enzyme (double-stranded beta helix superfamily)
MADAAITRPVGRTAGLRALTRRLDALVAASRDPHVVAPHVGDLLGRALADPSLLEPRHQEPADDRYRQHVVHVHHAGRYSIVALVWKPGQATPIHDHCCWCVVGVWRGSERETAYDLHDDRVGLHLVPRRTTLARPGDVSVLVPPDEDVHLVENAGESIAISLHVYGANIAERGTSINRTFDASLVRARPRVAAEPASWRKLAA